MERRSDRRKKRQTRVSFILAALLVLIMVAIVYVNGRSLHARLDQNRIRIEQLEQEIEDEKQRAASIEEYREYTRTDQFIEQIAREKLGLLYEGETIFREEDGR